MVFVLIFLDLFALIVVDAMFIPPLSTSANSFSLDGRYLTVNLAPKFAINQSNNLTTLTSDIARVVGIRLMRSQAASEAVQTVILCPIVNSVVVSKGQQRVLVLPTYSMTNPSIGDFPRLAHDCTWDRRTTENDPLATKEPV